MGLSGCEAGRNSGRQQGMLVDEQQRGRTVRGHWILWDVYGVIGEDV